MQPVFDHQGTAGDPRLRSGHARQDGQPPAASGRLPRLLRAHRRLTRSSEANVRCWPTRSPVRSIAAYPRITRPISKPSPRFARVAACRLAEPANCCFARRSRRLSRSAGPRASSAGAAGPLFRNQPHSDVEREIGPDPAHYHREPIAQADKEQNVHCAPQPPRHGAG